MKNINFSSGVSLVGAGLATNPFRSTILVQNPPSFSANQTTNFFCT
ncbi:MAG: hypothetical protein LH628_26125 [Microcoleus sp. CAN_BIN18]|nr:hypothetical protein [Microcoleus sp. CAN_BIN18]